jgi:hypothetical protein
MLVLGRIHIVLELSAAAQRAASEPRVEPFLKLVCLSFFGRDRE